MPDKDVIADLRRAKEEEYFRRKEQELVEKMRLHATLLAERQRMGEAVGIPNEGIIVDLQVLGYTTETVGLVHLVPLLQVAWIDGEVSERERKLILEVAGERGIEEGSKSYRQLSDWLDHPLSEEDFQKTLRVIRMMLLALSPEEREATKRDLLSCCSRVAAASGGILGLGRTISDIEHALLERITVELEQDHEATAKQVFAEVCEKTS